MGDKKTIAVDFDGTIAQLEEFPLIGEPISKAREALQSLKDRGFEIVVYTCRANPGQTKTNAQQVEQYLLEFEIPFDRIAEGEKPIAQYYIDDRAVKFEGDWDKVLKQIARKMAKQIEEVYKGIDISKEDDGTYKVVGLGYFTSIDEAENAIDKWIETGETGKTADVSGYHRGKNPTGIGDINWTSTEVDDAKQIVSPDRSHEDNDPGEGQDIIEFLPGDKRNQSQPGINSSICEREPGGARYSLGGKKMAREDFKIGDRVALWDDKEFVGTITGFTSVIDDEDEEITPDALVKWDSGLETGEMLHKLIKVGDKKIAEENKKYTFFWLTGQKEVFEGLSASDALNRAGYGGPDIAALDFYSEGEGNDYSWNAEKHTWEKIAESEGGKKQTIELPKEHIINDQKEFTELQDKIEDMKKEDEQALKKTGEKQDIEKEEQMEGVVPTSMPPPISWPVETTTVRGELKPERYMGDPQGQLEKTEDGMTVLPDGSGFFIGSVPDKHEGKELSADLFTEELTPGGKVIDAGGDFRVGEKVRNRKRDVKGTVVDGERGLFSVKLYESGDIIDIDDPEVMDWEIDRGE